MKVRAVLVLVSLAAATSAWAQEIPITGVVTTQDDGVAVPGATVVIEALHLSVVTGSDGRYRLKLPADAARGRLDIRVSASGLRPAVKTISVSPSGQSEDFTLRLSFGEEITVGSRAIGAEEEKAVPVDVIPPEQIERAPSTETNQIIQTIAPSFNFPRPTISDGTDTVRPATLRGLGPDQVLVMVNGKRRHASALVNANNSVGRGSSGVDLNAIPASAIENIEILRDGAAAQYGSDAIAGVINLVLKSDPQPLTLSAQRRRDRAARATAQSALDVELRSGGWLRLGARRAVFATAEYREPLRDQPRRARSARSDRRRRRGQQRRGAAEPPLGRLVLARHDDLRQLQPARCGRRRSRSSTRSAASATAHGSHGGFYRRALQAQNWPQIYPLGFLPLIQPRVIDTLAHRRHARRGGAPGSTTCPRRLRAQRFRLLRHRLAQHLARTDDRRTRPASTRARSATTS